MKRLFQRKKVEVESDPPAPSNQNTSTNSTPLPLRNNVAKPGSSDVAGTIGECALIAQEDSNAGIDSSY